jgi:hypothetical protein
MANEKQFTAKQVTVAVLEKVGEMVKKSKAAKELAKSEASANLQKVEIAQDFEQLTSLLKGEKTSPKEMDKCMAKGETENKKAPSSSVGKEKEEVHPEASDSAFDVKGKDSKSSDDARQGTTPNPEKNPKEQAEGNNELAGTTPTQVGQDGKNLPGGDEIKGHLKLAKFVGRMDYKRQSKQNQASVAAQSQPSGNAQAASSAQHTEAIRNK